MSAVGMKPVVSDTGVFGSSRTGSAICHLPLVAAVFVCSPLVSGFAGAMSLKMSLAGTAFADNSSQIANKAKKIA
jgi:hypothetical protein